jgi:N-formylglutamate deformylase
MKTVPEPSIINPNPTLPVVVNLPHGSSFIPAHLRDQFCVSDEELAEEQRKLVDWFVDDLYSPIIAAGASAISHNVSRFVCDPERFEDDAKECMFQRGMGVVYSHGTQRQRIRREISPQEREDLLRDLYRPYHAALTEQVRKAIDKFGRCIFLDGHSYQEFSLPYELYGDAPRPDVVFGDDPIHTPAWMRDEALRLSQEAGYSFGVNRPFEGTVVPLAFYGDTRVSSFMLEINRRTYMDERTTTLHEGVARMKALLGEMARVVSRMG